MNKQYMKEIQKWKKIYLRLMNSRMMTMLGLLYKDCSKPDISTVQRTETKESESGFLGLSSDSSWAT